MQTKIISNDDEIFSFLILASFWLGCIKKDTKCAYNNSNTIAPDSEIQSLKDSLDTAGITASQHPSGFFYNITGNGTGAGITNLCSIVTVTYKGSFFNGHIFDSTATGKVATFQLGQVIVGWQKGVPLISKGGDITLYIPPSLAYGPNPRSDNTEMLLFRGALISYMMFILWIYNKFLQNCSALVFHQGLFYFYFFRF